MSSEQNGQAMERLHRFIRENAEEDSGQRLQLMDSVARLFHEASTPIQVDRTREEPRAKIEVEQNSRGFNVSARLYGDDLDDLSNDVVDAIFRTQEALEKRQREREEAPAS